MLKGTLAWFRKSKIFLVTLILFFGVLVGLPIFGLAQDGSVNMQVNVTERKPTDTINDFQLTPTASVAAGKVLGAQSERAKPSNKLAKYWLILVFINPLLIIFI